EVQTAAARLEADQKQPRRSRLEFFDGFVPQAGFSGELGVGDFQAFDQILDQGKGLGKLRKQQDIAPLLQQLGQVFLQPVELGVLVDIGGFVQLDEARVDTGLAQL